MNVVCGCEWWIMSGCRNKRVEKGMRVGLCIQASSGGWHGERSQKTRNDDEVDHCAVFLRIGVVRQEEGAATPLICGP